jgi:hypothetical protein
MDGISEDCDGIGGPRSPFGDPGFDGRALSSPSSSSEISRGAGSFAWVVLLVEAPWVSL